MIIKLAIKVRVQQFEGGRRINFGFSFKRLLAIVQASAEYDATDYIRGASYQPSIYS